jgi:2-polyprenyl-3-methyl-5-hydroxy-6-metoxy-1,4-benzoquinol methylase
MAAEARFAPDWLSEDLARPPVNAALLDVGGGAFLLSCQLAAEGFAITAIESTGEGFGEFRRLGDIVLELAAAKLAIAPRKAADFISDKRFDFALSLNVMEHLDLPDEAIA